MKKYGIVGHGGGFSVKPYRLVHDLTMLKLSVSGACSNMDDSQLLEAYLETREDMEITVRNLTRYDGRSAEEEDALY